MEGVYAPENNAVVIRDSSPHSWIRCVDLFSFVHMHWREIFHSNIICNSTVLFFISSWYCDQVQRHPFKPNKNKLVKDFSQEIRGTDTKVEALQKKKKKEIGALQNESFSVTPNSLKVFCKRSHNCILLCI